MLSALSHPHPSLHGETLTWRHGLASQVPKNMPEAALTMITAFLGGTDL